LLGGGGLLDGTADAFVATAADGAAAPLDAAATELIGGGDVWPDSDRHATKNTDSTATNTARFRRCWGAGILGGEHT